MSFSDFNDLPNPTSIDGRGMVRYHEDRQMFVLFYRRSVEDPQASKQAGRRICRGVNYVKIQPPGERLTMVDRPVTEDDKRRWPNHWKAFVDNHQQIADGTPIDHLYPDYPEVADILRGNGVHTIEQCANLSGHAIESIGMGAQEYVNRARKYIETAEKGVAFHQHQQDLAERDQKIRLLQQQITILQQSCDKLTTMLQRVNHLPQGVVPTSPQWQPQPQPLTVAPMVPIPGVNIDGSFDVQTAQINAVHESKEEGVKVPKKMGRPFGSKNKPKIPNETA